MLRWLVMLPICFGIGGCQPAPIPQAAESPVPAAAQCTPQPAAKCPVDPRDEILPAGQGTAAPRLGAFRVGDAEDLLLSSTTQTKACKDGLFTMGCMLVDADGVMYEIADGAVIYVTVRADSYDHAKPLPFGIKFGDTLKEVVGKGNNIGVQWGIILTDESALLLFATKAYKESDQKEIFYVEVEFKAQTVSAVRYVAESL